MPKPMVKIIREDNFKEEIYISVASNQINIELEVAQDSMALQAVAVEIEAIAARQRQITAKIIIPHRVEAVWQVLTNYEALSDFIPNLASSRCLKHPNGGIRIEQIGSQRLLHLNFSARVVLDLEEHFPQEITFKMVEGDLKTFSGSWRLESYPLAEGVGTYLVYTVYVCPKRTMPIGIIERRLANDLRANLLAVCQRVEELANSLAS